MNMTYDIIGISAARRTNETSDTIEVGNFVVVDCGGCVLRVTTTVEDAMRQAEEIESEFDRETLVKVVRDDE